MNDEELSKLAWATLEKVGEQSCGVDEMHEIFMALLSVRDECQKEVDELRRYKIAALKELLALKECQKDNIELEKLAKEIGHKAYDYYDVGPEFLEFILKRLRSVRDECQKEIFEELKTLRRQSDTSLEELRLYCFHLKDPPSLTGVASRIQNIESEQREACYRDKLNIAHEEIERLLKRCTELADESRERMEANVECQNLSLPSEAEFRAKYELRGYFKNNLLSQSFYLVLKEMYNWLRANLKKQAPVSDQEFERLCGEWIHKKQNETIGGTRALFKEGFRAAEKHHGIGE